MDRLPSSNTREKGTSKCRVETTWVREAKALGRDMDGDFVQTHQGPVQRLSAAGESVVANRAVAMQGVVAGGTPVVGQVGAATGTGICSIPPG